MPPFFFSQMVVTPLKPEQSNRTKQPVRSPTPRKLAAGGPPARSGLDSRSAGLDHQVRSGHSTYYLPDSSRREQVVSERRARSLAKATSIPPEQPRKRGHLLLRVSKLFGRWEAEQVTDKPCAMLARRPTRAVTPSSPILPAIPEEEE